MYLRKFIFVTVSGYKHAWNTTILLLNKITYSMFIDSIQYILHLKNINEEQQ